jgi:Ca2+-binding EF-hand superfamily protein
MFAFLDKDKSQSLTIEEVTRGLKSILTDFEIIKLFQAIDNNKSNTLCF